MQIHESPNLHPLPDTPAGDAARDRFLADFLAICGDVRVLFMPRSGETTTTTDRSRYARTIYYSKDVTTFDTPPFILGSGFAVDFDGTDEEADIPVADTLSFVGPAGVDQPFTLFGLVNPTDATSGTVLSKYDTGQREYIFQTSAADKVMLILYDESAGTNIKITADAALTEGTDTLIAVTYDGSQTAEGMAAFKDGVRVAVTEATSGTYAGMENGTSDVGVGMYTGPNALWNGSIALAGATGKALTAEEHWLLKEAVNSYYDLSL